MLTCRNDVHVRLHCFILTEACSCRLELAYFAGKISKNRLVCKNAVALAYYGSCRLLVMGSCRTANLSIKDMLYGFRWNFSCGIKRVVPSGLHLARSGSQSHLAIWFMLPARGTCHTITILTIIIIVTITIIITLFLCQVRKSQQRRMKNSGELGFARIAEPRHSEELNYLG